MHLIHLGTIPISPKHLSVHRNTFRFFLPYFRWFRIFPKAFIPLSVSPYGSGRTPDMIETPLRSMINRVLWKAMLISVPSTMLFHR